jgi:hypothetical protein
LSELATTLLTMTRKTGLSGTQATTRRRCYDLRKIARHTQSAPPAHTGSKEQQDKLQGYGTDVLQWAQYASASQKC